MRVFPEDEYRRDDKHEIMQDQKQKHKEPVVAEKKIFDLESRGDNGINRQG